MLMIVNPTAGQGKVVDKFLDIIGLFTKAGFEVTVYTTADARHGYDITLARAAEFDYLVCAGGDGTLNELISALLISPPQSRPLLGLIPSGSSNDFANTHGIPSDNPYLAAQMLVAAAPTSVDMGIFQEDRFFCYVAAFGIFTDVSYDTPQGLKNMLGHAAYILQGVKKLANLKHHHCRIETESEVIEDDFIFGMVSNSRSVGGFRLPGDMNICLDDGRFELLLLKKVQKLEDVANVISVLRGAEEVPDSSFIIRSVKKVRIICKDDLSWSIDGEFGGSFKVTDIAVRQKALKALLPSPSQAITKKRG